MVSSRKTNGNEESWPSCSSIPSDGIPTYEKKPKSMMGEDSGVLSQAEDSGDLCVNEGSHGKYDQYVAFNAQKHFRNSKLQKYYIQRYQLFSKLDEGILMDEESWFSVTPEKIAEHIADRVIFNEDILVVDGFAGVGGNAIQFALKGAYVIAVDIDPIKIFCAKKNAKIYGVLDRIKFVKEDFLVFAEQYSKMLERIDRVSKRSKRKLGCSLPSKLWNGRISSVFLSPPWGGLSYTKKKDFRLDDIRPNGEDIFNAAKKLSMNIAYYLPRQTGIPELVALCGPGRKCEIELHKLNGRLKAITAYYGAIVPK